MQDDSDTAVHTDVRCIGPGLFLSAQTDGDILRVIRIDTLAPDPGNQLVGEFERGQPQAERWKAIVADGPHVCTENVREAWQARAGTGGTVSVPGPAGAETGQTDAQADAGGQPAQPAADGGASAQTDSGGAETTSGTGQVSDDVLLGQARTWLDQTAGLTEGFDLSRETHAGTDGVAIDPDTDAMPTAQYEGLKSTIGETDGCSFHVGFGDDPCHACGGSDGRYYLHVGKRVLGEVDG